jgi:hypothetical protein
MQHTACATNQPHAFIFSVLLPVVLFAQELEGGLPQRKIPTLASLFHTRQWGFKQENVGFFDGEM